MRPGPTLLSFLFVLGWMSSRPAAAQTTGGGPAQLEIGAVASKLMGDGPARLGVRLRVAATEHLAIVGIDWTDVLHEQPYGGQVLSLHFWQLKHTVWRGEESAVFATYGSAAWVARRQQDRTRFEAPVLRPKILLGGIGAQRVLRRQVAVRGDVQVLVWPFTDGLVAARLSGGVSIPFSGSGLVRREGETRVRRHAHR